MSPLKSAVVNMMTQTLDLKPRNLSDARARARDLILQNGRNTFSWQMLNPGTTLWLSRNKQAAAGYVLYGKMRMVSGTPVTHPENLKSASAEFEMDAREQGHRVCYFGAQARMKEIFQKSAAHKIILLGAQPAWDPRLWHTSVSQKNSLRELIRYAARKGVIVEENAPEEVCLLPEYRECIDAWVQSRKLPRLQFLANPDVLNDTRGRRFFSARREGGLIGFLSLVPIAGRNGWLIEHIFRGHDAVRGMNEYLIDSVMRVLAKEGAAYATLGLAPLSQRAGLSYDINPAWVRAVFRWLYTGMSGLYNFSGLDGFKSKFKPHVWEPVYGIVNKPRFSPMTLYRIAGAFCRTSPAMFGLTAFCRALLSLID